VRDVVRRADELWHVAVQDRPQVGVATTREHELLRFVVLTELHDLVGQHADGLLPRDGLELGVDALAFLGVGSAHWLGDPVGVVQLLDTEILSRTVVCAVDLRVLVPRVRITRRVRSSTRIWAEHHDVQPAQVLGLYVPVWSTSASR